MPAKPETKTERFQLRRSKESAKLAARLVKELKVDSQAQVYEMALERMARAYKIIQ